MVPEMIRLGWLILVFGGQESQNYSRRAIRLESTQIRWFTRWLDARLYRFPGGHSKAIFSQAKAKRDYEAQVHLDQMVLVLVKQEAGLVAQ
jgi:hypothetical protein